MLETILIILGVVAGLLIVSYIVMYIGIYNIFHKNYDVRKNDNHTLHYFTVDDFENLTNEPLSFKTYKDITLNGYLYSSTLYKEYKGLVVVSHGLGAGHLQYTTQINWFAERGYLVFAFDDTACNLSEGERLRGLTQGLIDLDYALRYIEQEERFKGMKIILYGHSMGGYAVNNVTSLDHKVDAVISLAPFKDEASLTFESFGNITSIRNKFVYYVFKMEVRRRFKEYSKLNTIDSLDQSDVPHLIIAGDHDLIADYNKNFLIFRDTFYNKKDYYFYTAEGRAHRPDLTKRANDYDEDTNDDYRRLLSDFKNNIPEERLHKFYDSLDYKLLTELDEEVMVQIDKFLNSIN